MSAATTAVGQFGGFDKMTTATATAALTESTTPLPLAKKPNHAIVMGADGKTRRTIWGYFLPEDVDVIAEAYPEIPRDMITQIATVRNDDNVELIPAPRLLEVLVPIELVARFLRGEYSRIKRGIPEGLKLVANPLSILSWVDGVVQRVVTNETELMHKPAEKLALRTGALAKLNAIFAEHFGLKLAYGCSCCALVFQEQDEATVLGSGYYNKREQMGRWYDSDTLVALDRLHGPMRMRDVPQKFIDGSVDFGVEEVTSYERFASVAQACLDGHPGDNVVNIDDWHMRAACFIGGDCQRQGEHCPLPPAAAKVA